MLPNEEVTGLVRLHARGPSDRRERRQPPGWVASSMPNGLQIFGRDTGVLYYASEHARAYFFAIVKRKNNVGPSFA